MGRGGHVLEPRRLAIAGALCACLWPAGAVLGAPPDGPPPQFVAQQVSPHGGYYGPCGDNTPIGVTVRAEVASPLGLAVLLSYRFVSADPRTPPSPLLSTHMPLYAAGLYMAAIDLADQAPAYLKGADGSLQYWVEAKDSRGSVVSSAPGSVDIR